MVGITYKYDTLRKRKFLRVDTNDRLQLPSFSLIISLRQRSGCPKKLAPNVPGSARLQVPERPLCRSAQKKTCPGTGSSTAVGSWASFFYSCRATISKVYILLLVVRSIYFSFFKILPAPVLMYAPVTSQK